MDPETCTLPNGIRLVHRPVSSPVAHTGIFIHAGTRDEAEGERGIAHFIEHTIFKGTRKRSVYRILNRLENVGADLNAFTTKEDTCIYASFLSAYYDRALELYHDIFFHSVFPEKELEKEKQVIIDEIRSYMDTPSEQIMDDFEDLVFRDHPLGHNILGTAGSLKKITQEDIFRFIRETYRYDRIVIASIGNISFPKLTRMVYKYFNRPQEPGRGRERQANLNYYPTEKRVKKKILQVHCSLGGPAFSFADDRRIPLALLNNILGGPILNSRLSLALRERNGLTYHNESNYVPYTDTGIFSIYFATDPGLFERALSIVFRELKRLREKKLNPVQLHTIKKQLTGQMAIGQESNLSVMLAMGKSFLVQGRFDSFELLTRRIESVTAEQLLYLSNDLFEPSKMSLLTFNPSR